MINTFTVFSSSVETFKGKKGEQSTLRVTLLDASAQPMSQFFEWNLPAESTAPAKGVQVTLDITEISSVFAGRPRIRGNIVPAKK
jgi:hypothetical protein